MATIYFTKRFSRGLLTGLYHTDCISFPTAARCVEWMKTINRRASTLGYVIVDRSFQNYNR